MSAAAAMPSIDPRFAADLFPDAVATLASSIDATLADLLPEERPAVLRAVPKRQREFATGRRAARDLLAGLGLGRPALPRNADRTVAWPDAVVGTISHCDDLCAVAVARRGAIDGIGVDVEPDLPLEPALWRRIATPGEIDRVVRSLPGAAEQGRAARFVFCAKEAFYKSVHARVGRVLGFHEVEIQVDWESGRFLAWLEGTPTGAPDGTRFEGRFARRHGFVIAGATLHLESTEGTAR